MKNRPCLDDLAAQIGAAPFEVVLHLQEYPSGVREMLAERFSRAFPRVLDAS